MLEGLRDGFGWTPVLEAGNIIGWAQRRQCQP